MPPHRLRETTTARTQAEKERDDLKTKLELAEKRTRAALGIDPVAPKDAERAEVEQVLSEILEKKYPGLPILQKLTSEQLEQVLQAAQSANAATSSYYDRHSDEMLGAVETEIAKQMGIDALTPTQRHRVRQAYFDEARAAMATREQAAAAGDTREVSTDFMARHLRSDKTLVAEFAKAFLEDFFVPARRVVTQSLVRRGGRPVPSGGRSEPVTTTTPKIDFNNDEAFGKALVEARRVGSG